MCRKDKRVGPKEKYSKTINKKENTSKFNTIKTISNKQKMSKLNSIIIIIIIFFFYEEK